MPQPDSIDDETLPDALRDALGKVIADERRHGEHRYEVLEARSQTILADLRATIADRLDGERRRMDELQNSLQQMVAERLGQLRDGMAGDPGPRGEQGERGHDGQQGPPGPSGKDGEIGPQGERGEQGPQGEQGRDGDPGPAGERGLVGDIGPQGPEGPAGKFPAVKLFAPDGVHYAGEVVAHNGATFQAIKDTGTAPPSKDWVALAVRGQDARSFEIRGTWAAENDDYLALDVVALNGGTFIARHDNPGPCPGAGWQLIARQGKPGNEGAPGPRGEPGPQGERGPKGEAAPRLTSWRIDPRDYRAIGKMSDGSETVLDLRELFEQFQTEIAS
jgi:hypothetical protein